MKITNENLEAATKCLREIIDCPFDDFNTTAKIRACEALSLIEFSRLSMQMKLSMEKSQDRIMKLLEKGGFYVMPEEKS